MTTVFLMIGLLLGGITAWHFVKSMEQTRHLTRIRELESKYRFSQGENTDLKEQMISLRGEVAVLQKNLDEERVSKNTVIAGLTESFKKGVLVMGITYFACGISLGGVISWFAASARAEARGLVRTTELELNRQLAVLRAEVLEKQAGEMQKNIDALRLELTDEKVEKTVALTKLRILLQSLSSQKGVEGFVLDYQRLKENLNREIEVKPAQREFSLRPPSAPPEKIVKPALS